MRQQSGGKRPSGRERTRRHRRKSGFNRRKRPLRRDVPQMLAEKNQRTAELPIKAAITHLAIVDRIVLSCTDNFYSKITFNNKHPTIKAEGCLFCLFNCKIISFLRQTPKRWGFRLRSANNFRFPSVCFHCNSTALHL